MIAQTFPSERVARLGVLFCLLLIAFTSRAEADHGSYHLLPRVILNLPNLLAEARFPATPAPTPAPVPRPTDAELALLQAPVPPEQPAPQAPVPLPPDQPAPQVPVPVPPEQLPPPAPAPGAAEAERPRAEKPREAALLERGAILLPMGTLQVEPGLEYDHFSADRVAISGFTIFEAIVIGTIRVDRINRDILIGALTTRFGLLDRLQIDAKAPFIYRRDTEILGVGTPGERERPTQTMDLGDMEGTVSGQAFIGGGALPDVILKLGGRLNTGKSAFEIPTVSVGPGETRLLQPPTGSGFKAVTPGGTLVWRTDPVVFFLGGGYAYSFGRDLGRAFGTINPGASIQGLAGLNLAVSERVAVNFTFVDQFTNSTRQNGVKRPGTSLNDARLVLGTSISLLPSLTLLVSAGVGLTKDSPDFTFTFSLPVTFKLF